MLRMLNNTRNQKIASGIAAGLCVLTVGLVPNWEYTRPQLEKLQVLGGRRMAPVSDQTAAPELAAISESPVLSARAALAYDFQSGSILYANSFDEKMPVASLTKLLAALVIMDSGKVNTVVEVTEEDIRVIGVNTGLVVGERIMGGELLKAMLIASHNDSTRALCRYVGGTLDEFVRMMNEKARALGMQSTRFTNVNGFDDAGHYSTAQDMSLVLKEFLSNPTLSEIVKTKETVIKPVNLPFDHRIKTTNKLLLEDPTVVGVKTGYTTEAKGNLVIRSIDGKADVVTIILGSDDREADSRKILDWIYTVYRW